MLSFLVGVVVGVVAAVFFYRHKTQSAFTEDEADTFGAEGRAAVSERIEKRKEKIMARAHELGQITNDDVEELFCISNSTATNYLRLLTREGKLERFGKGRATHYKPTIS